MDYEEEIVCLEVGAKLQSIEQARKTAEDNAWDHAKESAEVLGFEFGDDEFVTIFQELNKRYLHNVEHLQFFMVTALMLTKSLIEKEHISIFFGDEKLREDEVAARIGNIASAIVNSFTWIAGGYELTWLTNEDLPDDLKVKFYFKPDNIIDEEEDELWS